MPHIQFEANLAMPPLERTRRQGLVYPRVAQIKGESNWKDYEDLYWGKRPLSSVSREGLVEGGATISASHSTPESSMLRSMDELTIAASKVASTSKGTGARRYSTHLVRKKQSSKFLAFDGPTATPPLSTPSSSSGSSQSSEAVTPTEEFDRPLHVPS